LGKGEVIAMFLLHKPESHLIDQGRVLCPLRGDIDVEQCFDCPALRSLELNGPEPRVTCEALRPGPWRTPAEFGLLSR